MQDRIAELRRQRALVADHLAWLDREIAAATPAEFAVILDMSAASATKVLATPQAAPFQPAAKTVLAPHASDAHPPLPDHDPAHIKDHVRRGCFLYVALAALLVVLGGALLIWASQEYKARHPPAPRPEQVE